MKLLPKNPKQEIRLFLTSRLSELKWELSKTIAYRFLAGVYVSDTEIKKLKQNRFFIIFDYLPYFQIQNNYVRKIYSSTCIVYTVPNDGR
jgi:hypothetical protein